MGSVIEYVAVVCRLIAGMFVVDESVDRMKYMQYYRVRFEMECESHDYTGQQNLTFFFGQRTTIVNLAVPFMLNSDMLTECFYQAEFQRHRGLYLCKIVPYVLMKQAETYL